MRRVGLAPGTITMTQDAPRGTTIPTPGFASPWNPSYPDPSQRYMPKGATIVGGAMVPHDFELAKIYGYTPYMQGWTVGTIAAKHPQIDRTILYRGGFGQNGAFAPGEPTPGTTPAPQITQEQLLQERLKTERVMRTWTIIGGVVGVGGLLIALLSLGRR